MQDCNKSIANAQELLQSCTKPLKYVNSLASGDASIGAGDDGNKPLPEPMLTHYQWSPVPQGITKMVWIINSLWSSGGIIKLSHHWLKEWIVTCSVSSHYLNQWLLIINSTLQNTFQWNFSQISHIHNLFTQDVTEY